MAKAGKKAIPAKRGTKRGRTRRTGSSLAPADTKKPFVETPANPHGSSQAPSSPNQPANSPPPVLIARMVPIIPANRKEKGYHEADVRAVQRGNFAGRTREPGDVFRVGIIGEGELPSWVRRA